MPTSKLLASLLDHLADFVRDTNNINEKRDGLDFFYTERNNAIKMCDFLSGVVPVR
jgi:NMD protein affecting ribosome stability and mRNA decay